MSRLQVALAVATTIICLIAAATFGAVLAEVSDSPPTDGVTVTHYQEYTVAVGPAIYTTACAGHGFRIFRENNNSFFVVSDPSCEKVPR